MWCIGECFLWRFLFAIYFAIFAILQFQSCKISCAMNSWCLSCSLPHVQSEWRGICLICLKYKVIFMKWFEHQDWIWNRGKQQLRKVRSFELKTIMRLWSCYKGAVHCQLFFPLVPLCNMLFVLQSTNDFYWMFSHILLTTFVYQISIILPKHIILSCKNSRQMSK